MGELPEVTLSNTGKQLLFGVFSGKAVKHTHTHTRVPPWPGISLGLAPVYRRVLLCGSSSRLFPISTCPVLLPIGKPPAPSCLCTHIRGEGEPCVTGANGHCPWGLGEYLWRWQVFRKSESLRLPAPLGYPQKALCAHWPLLLGSTGPGSVGLAAARTELSLKASCSCVHCGSFPALVTG